MHCTKEWNINNSANDKPLLDRLLELRGITTEEDKKIFLNPLEITLLHPNAFCDMPKAVSRISDAIQNKENILIYGDFDADGVTSTAVLLKTLRYLGANVDYYIPNRETEGHGLNSKILVQMISRKNPKLIITVDNGISNVEEVKMINALHRDVIITDHHEAPEILPEAYAIINPKSMDALHESLNTKQIEYMTSLAGVGVAFKLAQALLEKFDKLDFCYEILPFVTVGTIADLVPLIGENRYFVARGLELIAQGKHYGLKRILDVAGLNCDSGLTAEQIAFTVAPRINASGRLDTVDAALKILISDNKQEIEVAVITLENYNKLRQTLCSETFEQADEQWRATGMHDNAIVLFNKDWHVGIVGIVASKFVEKYYKPAFIITYSEETKQYKCSARGVKELNIYEIMSNFAEKLDGFGGHKLAGGFSFSEDNISFEEVKKTLNCIIDENLAGKKLIPSLDIDLELNIDEVDIPLVEEIQKLEPFGMSNNAPVFAVKNVKLKQKKLMGSTKEHLKLIIETPSGPKDCIWWSRGDIPLVEGDIIDVAFAPQLNIFNGNTDVQLIIKDIHSEALEADEIAKIKIYDHRKKQNIYAQVNDYINTSRLNISVFVEDKTVMDMLKPYTHITDKIINRQSISKCDALMFFDYPANEDILEKIKQSAGASAIHYMNYQNFKPNYEELFKMFSGMLKYTCNNLNGKFELTRGATALGITEEVVEVLLEMFRDCKMINISERNENFYCISFISGIELSTLLNSAKYPEFTELMDTINDYKNSFMMTTL